MEDRFIVKYIERGKERGLELLIDKYGGLIKAVIRKYLFKLSEYEEECIDYNRKYLKYVEDEELDFKNIEDSNRIDNELLHNELKDSIEGLLQNLSPGDRNIFKRVYLQDVKVEEVAKEMGVKTSYIYNRVSRGKNKLRKLINLNDFL